MSAPYDVGRAYWACAGFTLFSAVVSAGFSLLSLRMVGGQEYALYAASRSVALPLAAVYAMALRSRGGVAALAVTMILVQLFERGHRVSPQRSRQGVRTAGLFCDKSRVAVV